MDSKKLFPEKKASRRKLLEFLDKKGFYVVLILCILIVGVTAVIITTRTISPSNTDYESQKIIPDVLGQNTAVDNAAKESVQSSVSTDKADKSPANTENAQSAVVNAAKPDNTATAVTSNKETASTVDKSTQTSGKVAAPKKKEASMKFIMPVFGQVTFEYAQDKLVYSKTLEEWRTHSGVDISADRGTPVKAVADGVVSDIKNDPRFGITIIIDHQDGTKTVYANLASDDTVSPNQKVKQGDVIGAVGNSAGFESAEQSHLHFEVLKDDEPVDPTAFLPKSTN